MAALGGRVGDRHRGALVDAVVASATDRGAQRLITSVTEGNAAAAALYAAAAFADTGRREPLGHSAGVVAVLERPLGPSKARCAASGRRGAASGRRRAGRTASAAP